MQAAHTLFDDWKGLLLIALGLGLIIYTIIQIGRHPGRWVSLNDWVGQLATTNWRIFTGVLMALGTMVFYFGSEIRCIAYTVNDQCRPIDGGNFALWLSFVAAWSGISVYQFKVKRDTYASPSPDSERAGVPALPTPTSPATTSTPAPTLQPPEVRPDV